MANNLPPNKHLHKHIIEGIKFAEEMLDALDEISLKYNMHISDSINLGNFESLDTSLTHSSRKLVEYKQKYENILKKYNEYSLEFRHRL
jgi:trehalose/maltose hydrolase-like predicted phosphorylase